MPELPEVETVRRGLIPKLVGRRLARVEQRRKDLRFPLPPRLAERLAGRRVLAIERRAKYLLWRLDGGETLMLHLGMSGRMVLVAPGEGAKRPLDAHDHLVFVTDTGCEVRFNDARRFGMVDLVADAEVAGHRLLRALGPEPLDDAFDGAALAARLAGKRTPIKSALLDQRVLVGIGNIYACEGLFLAGLSPRRMASTVQGDRAERLVRGLKQVLRRAIADGGSTLRDHVQPDGELGYFQTRFAVYDREGERCPGCTCKAGVRRIVQAGRSTFYCSRRQR